MTPYTGKVRHQDNRHTRVSSFEERLQRLHHQPRWHLTAVEQITTVDHQIDLPPQRRFKGETGVGKKVRPTPPLLHPGSQRHVKPEVGVGQEQDFDHIHRLPSRTALVNGK